MICSLVSVCSFFGLFTCFVIRVVFVFSFIIFVEIELVLLEFHGNRVQFASHPEEFRFLYLSLLFYSTQFLDFIRESYFYSRI